MRQYLDLMQHILDEGVRKSDRTGTGTLSRLRLPDALRSGARLSAASRPRSVHLKSHHPRAAVVPPGRHQRRLPARERRHHLGRVGRRATASSGPVYGYQWRSWPAPDGRHIDQIAQVVRAAPAQPRLAPAHRLGVERRRHPDAWRWRPATRCSSSTWPTAACRCQLYQRSADFFLGVPFNIASYALLTLMVAQVMRAATRRVRAHARATRTCTSTTSSRRASSSTRAPRALPPMRLNPEVQRPVRLPLRGLRARGLRPAPGDQGAGSGLGSLRACRQPVARGADACR